MDLDQPLENFLKPPAPAPRPVFTVTFTHPEALGRLWGYLSQFCYEFSLDVVSQQMSKVEKALLTDLKLFFRRQEKLQTASSSPSPSLRAYFLFKPAVKVLLSHGPQVSDWTGAKLPMLTLWSGKSPIFLAKAGPEEQAFLDTTPFDPTQVRIKGFLQLVGIPFQSESSS